MKFRNLVPAAFAALSFVLVPAATLPLTAGDVFQQNTRLGRGVNVLGWDALWQDRARGQFSVHAFDIV